MKKIKLLTVTVFAVSVMAIGTACSSGTSGQINTTAQATEATTEAVSKPTEETKVDTTSDKTREEQQITGVLDQNKGFMFTLKADDGEVYALNVEEEDMIKDLKSGDKLVITYTGEAPNPTDVTDTVIIKIEKAK